MTAELDRVRPGESSRCGALLKMREVANKAGGNNGTLPECLAAKPIQYVLEVLKIDG